jgi:hypothetical protein
MKLIDFNKISKIYNKRIKYYDYIDYTKVIEEYKIYLKYRYKIRKNKNYINTLNSIYNILYHEKTFIPTIQKSPISYSLRNIKIDNIEYNIITELGSGYYGKVYKVEINDKIYALKETELVNNHYISTYLNEINKLKIINKIKPKIAPKYYKSWINNNKGYILLEYINCGTLYEYIKKNELSVKDYNELKRLINILHKYNLFHRDLHGGNILIECKNKKKIRFYLNDFGLSKKKTIILDDNYSIIKELNQTEKYFINNELNNITIIEMVKILVIDYIIKNNLIFLK